MVPRFETVLTPRGLRADDDSRQDSDPNDCDRFITTSCFYPNVTFGLRSVLYQDTQRKHPSQVHMTGFYASEGPRSNMTPFGLQPQVPLKNTSTGREKEFV